MTWSVEPPVETAKGTICILSECDCHISAFGEGFLGSGSKVPRVIVLIRDGEISGMDMGGRPLSEEDLDRRFPGALDALRNRQ